jgi:hypothetical protein
VVHTGEGRGGGLFPLVGATYPFNDPASKPRMNNLPRAR